MATKADPGPSVKIATVRIFLVDDHELVRQGLRALFEAEDDLEVVAEAGSMTDAIAMLGELDADVALVDLRLPDGDGVTLCREMRSRCPDLRYLVLTSFADDEALLGAVMAGASGYLLKQIKGNDLVDSVRRVAKGESLLDEHATSRVLDRLRPDHPADGPLSQLSEQERRILHLIAQGYTNRQIAETIELAEKTVKNYVSNVLAKLGMSRRSEAAAYAARLEERRRRRSY